MVTEVKRKGRLNVRLDNSMTLKLEKLAFEMGIPASTLGAVAIAEYVNNKASAEKMQEKVAAATAEKNAEILKGFIADPAAMQLLASIVEPDDKDQQRLEGV